MGDPDLKKLLLKLIESNADFVLIGGFAATVHGGTLVTQDLDICAAITEDNIQKLRKALKDINPRHRMNPNAKHSFLDYPPSLAGVKNIYLETDLGIVDILSKTHVGDFTEIRERSIEIPLFGHRCRVISIEDLIQIKDAMNRPKDVQTAEELRIILKKTSN